MRILAEQTSFIAGAIDQSARGRTDSAAYRAGAARLLNCLPLVTGGMLSRWGTRHLDILPATFVMEEFAFSLEQSYIACFLPERVEFYYAEDGLTAGGLTSCPWTADQLRELRFAQSGDVMWVVHPDFEPQIIRRLSTNTWSRVGMPFDSPAGRPFFRYANSAVSVTHSELRSVITLQDDRTTPGATGRKVRVRRAGSGGAWVEGVSVSIAGSGLILTVDWLSTAPLPGLRYEVQFAAAGGVSWADDSAGFPAAATGRLVFSEEVLSAAYLGKALRIWDPDLALWSVCEITTVTDDDDVDVTWVNSTPTTGVALLQWDEEAFSATRGYPRTVCLYQQRLVFGGGRDAGDVIWMSKTAQFFNFDLGTAGASDGIQVALASGRVRTITNSIGSAPQLTFTTEASTLYLPTADMVPLTPTSVKVDLISPHGAGNVRPGAFDNGLLFVQTNGRAVRDLSYSEEADNVVSVPVSLLATDILGEIVDATYLPGSPDRPEQYALFVNTAGKIAVFHSVRDQQIGSWVEWETDGAFLSVGSAGGNVFAAVLRNGTVRLEMFDPTRAFDASLLLRPGFALPHLPDSEIHGRVGTDYLGSGTSNEFGWVTLTRETHEVGGFPFGVDCELGLPFVWEIEPLPPALTLPDGPLTQRRQRLFRISLQLIGAQAAMVAGKRLMLLNDGFNPSATPPEFDGWWKARVLGWSWGSVQPVIERNVPLPTGVLSMLREVAIP